MAGPLASESSPISRTFADLKARGRMAFMPFVTAGDPDLETTAALIQELARRGVDLVEVGFPYSDPIADGPVIQASYTRALRRGIRVRDIFRMIGRLNAGQVSAVTGDPGDAVSPPAQSTSAPDASGSAESPRMPPLVAMVSCSIILRHGVELFLDEAREAGFAGLIVPDLPGDEAGSLPELARNRQLDLIQLVSPTTPAERAARIVQAASGFVYCISVAGTTGVRQDLPAELRDQLAWLRRRTDLPLAVGFGISRPEQVGLLHGQADGVIVGSAIVRQLEPLTQDPGRAAAVIHEAGEFAARMLAAS
jgi:tryptophan synthase alpha chain